MKKISIILIICFFSVFVMGNCQEAKANTGEIILTSALIGLVVGLIGYMIDSQRKIADSAEKNINIEKHIVRIESNKNVKIKINNNNIGITPLKDILITRDLNEIVVVAAYSEENKLLEQKTYYSDDNIPRRIYFDINN